MPARSTDARSPLKQVEFLALAVLFDEPLHGYGIVQLIAERTNGRVRLRPGDVYRVIYRLAQRGLLEESAQRGADAGDERRTYYAITAAGKDLAQAEAEMLTEVSSALMSKAGGQGSRR